MMRYSSSPRLHVTEIGKPAGAPAPVSAKVVGVAPPSVHSALFDAVSKATRGGERIGGLLFVGGSGPHDVAVRWAQAPLRMDRTPSHWSHVAVILHWPDGATSAEEVIGAEVTLDPENKKFHLPESNGVTLFHLARYLDRDDRYPNLAFATIRPRLSEMEKKMSPEERIQVLRTAALTPVRDRARYPLWEWLGLWAQYVYSSRENPLLAHVSHPGAAYCEYVYESIGVDLTPGANAPDTCPDTLWSTLLYWYEQVGESKDAVRVWSSLAKDDGLVRSGTLRTLPDAFTMLTRESQRGRGAR